MWYNNSVSCKKTKEIFMSTYGQREPRSAKYYYKDRPEAVQARDLKRKFFNNKELSQNNKFSGMVLAGRFNGDTANEFYTRLTNQ
tara:strand:- start:1202 stop:1456 length:255 start_codon:yes stop_codon:yes gene_type:complete